MRLFLLVFFSLVQTVVYAQQSLYWAVYDKQKDKKITPAVWDLDLTVGCSTLLQYSEEFISPEYPLLDPQYEDDTFISNTTYQSDNPNIYSLFGQRINNLNQCKSNIYIINRKKVFIK